MEVENTTSTDGYRIRYIRSKDLGTKIKDVDTRNKRLVELAQPLLRDSELSARTVYWFVTTEEALLSSQDIDLFGCKEKGTFDEQGTSYFTYQVDFQKDRCGELDFKFPDGSIETIKCQSSAMKRKENKRMKLTEDDAEQGDAIEEEYRPSKSINTNMISSLVDDFQKISNDPISPPSRVPQSGQRLRLNEPLVSNILLLVPSEGAYLSVIQGVLQELGFQLEAESTQQKLFSQYLTCLQKHILVFPYVGMKEAHRLLVLQDYLTAMSEVILVMENGAEQSQDLMMVSRILNVNGNPYSHWFFKVKALTFPSVDSIKHATLRGPAKDVLKIDALHKIALSVLSVRAQLEPDQLTSGFKNYIAEWLLAHIQRNAVPNIFVCFKCEPRLVTAHSDCAKASLAALNIEYGVDTVYADYDLL